MINNNIIIVLDNRKFHIDLVIFLKARKSTAFSKTRLGSALIILFTALRDYGLLTQVHGLVCSVRQ